MSIRKITETANPDKIDSNGSATVTLGFETLAGTTGQPSAIVFLVNTSARTAQYMKYIIPGAVSAVRCNCNCTVAVINDNCFRIIN